MKRMSDIEFDRIHDIGKTLKEIFHRDGFDKVDGNEDYIVGAVEEATRLTQRAADGCQHLRQKINRIGIWVCVDCGDILGSNRR